MTYRELREVLANLSTEQLNMDVTVELDQEDEYYPATLLFCGSNHDVLDNGHPVIYVK